VAMWQSLMCLVLSCNQFKVDLLKGDTIEVTTILNPPFLQLKNNSDELVGNDKYEGYNVDLLKKLEHQLGAKFNINLVKDGNYGYCDPSSANEANHCYQWNGMIGEVYNGYADMALADITVAPLRVLAVDFTQSFMHGGLVILANRNAPDSLNSLIRQGYKFLVIGGGSTQKFIESSTSLGSSNLDFSSKSLQEAYKKMKSDDKSVMVVESNSAKVYTGKDCSVKILNEQLNDVSFGIALPKGSAKRIGGSVYDIRTLLDYAITTLKYQGELNSLENKWWPQPNC